MEEIVQKELAALRQMVLTWKQSYLGLAEPARDCGFLAQEFREEIDMHVYPYAKRLYECNYLSESEMAEFFDFCYRQVEELRRALQAS